MFDKLKKKFVLINMTLLTTVFVAIFGTIFAITYTNIVNEMNGEMEVLLRGGHKPKPYYDYIIAEYDRNKNVLNTFTRFNTKIDNNNLKESVVQILNNKSRSGKIEIGDTKYSYTKEDTPMGSKIVLLNRTYLQNTVTQLLKSFLLVGCISLIALLFISFYLTNKALKPIKETFEKQKQFIADASHELKTPLTIIKTNTSLVLSNPNDAVKNQSKWINYINSQCDRMSELVNEMLSLAKLDVEENKIELQSINISKIVQSIMLGFDAIIYENGIELEENISNDIFINGDTEGIKKLFNILMDNAIKHSNKSGKITVDLFKDKNKVKLIVKNTGEGIEPEYLEKIFERFYRIDTSRVRETGGYGLGLSIAKSIVAQHKGKIYAKSNVGKDTTFIVELPLQ
ncbi:sensor histidine kinase [Romboutsia hominis]|uniref:histidine kinase n=1 Tax=Romboutsia hominis TaxID=1507512 RepID=A0A2P2BN17_9FIRM|nr:HAMP domain-containing sensor histidine kinase [Romboutsia hominis]MCH1958542.1 HAMP domain-containing histidine kinase [Romboutsia hominis]MCH1970460.1 HAMP domain-containing histidine kinase [Romboutsia hominis]CEI71783.1 Sensor protein DltS [Romboutsia hominis]